MLTATDDHETFIVRCTIMFVFLFLKGPRIKEYYFVAFIPANLKLIPQNCKTTTTTDKADYLIINFEFLLTYLDHGSNPTWVALF